MSSGQKRIVFNSRERLVSTDLERTQAFIGRGNAELLRHLLLTTLLEDLGRTEPVPSTSPALGPLTGIILNGFRLRPTAAGVELLIEPGVALVIDPDTAANPDDSPAKLIIDPGVQVVGALALTAGDPAAIRIDVIEAARSELVVESDSRDIFDAPSALFTGALQNKVVEGRFTYRIRLGAPGGGFPGVAAGWLPLAVVSVPVNALTWGDCIIWDVRPLLFTRPNPPFLTVRFLERYQIQYGQMVSAGMAGGQLDGTFELEGPSFSRIGGGIISQDLADVAAVHEPGFVPLANQIWYLYYALPFGLPNWGRYVLTSGELQPSQPFGIPVLTHKAPIGFLGVPFIPLTLPTGTGLGGVTQQAAVATCGAINSLGNFETTVSDGRRGWTSGTGTSVAGAVVGNVATYALTAGVHYPSNAVALRVEIVGTLTGMAGATEVVDRALETRNLANTASFVSVRDQRPVTMVMGGYDDTFDAWVPLTHNVPIGLPANQFMRTTWGAATFILGASTLRVIGWELGL